MGFIPDQLFSCCSPGQIWSFGFRALQKLNMGGSGWGEQERCRGSWGAGEESGREVWEQEDV